MSEHPKIEIRISGVAGSGKSTAARSIARALIRCGFKVYLSDGYQMAGPLRTDSAPISTLLPSHGWGQPAEITVCEPGQEG